MKILTPTPECAEITQVVDGYQLCAQCGEPLVADETAILVPRSRSWLIYTHEINPSCKPKAVRGWKAVRFAEAVRKLENDDVFREAEPYDVGGLIHKCVCLLDDKHVKAELKLVEYWPSDEAVANGGVDIRVLLSRYQLRAAGNGRRTNVPHNQETGVDRGGARGFLIRNFIEDALIAAIDENSLNAGLQAYIECLLSCRRKTYATARKAPSIETPPLGAVGKMAEVRVGVATRRKRSPKADSVLSRDVKDNPGEFPLYSKKKILKINRKWISEFECWAPKPDRVELPYNSITHPELYLWVAKSLRQLDPVDRDNPYGPVALLMRESIETLNAQRNEAFRGENIQWEVHEEAVPAMAVPRDMAQHDPPIWTARKVARGKHHECELHDALTH